MVLRHGSRCTWLGSGLTTVKHKLVAALGKLLVVPACLVPVDQETLRHTGVQYVGGTAWGNSQGNDQSTH